MEPGTDPPPLSPYIDPFNQPCHACLVGWKENFSFFSWFRFALVQFSVDLPSICIMLVAQLVLVILGSFLLHVLICACFSLGVYLFTSVIFLRHSSHATCTNVFVNATNIPTLLIYWITDEPEIKGNIGDVWNTSNLHVVINWLFMSSLLSIWKLIVWVRQCLYDSSKLCMSLSTTLIYVIEWNNLHRNVYVATSNIHYHLKVYICISVLCLKPSLQSHSLLKIVYKPIYYLSPLVPNMTLYRSFFDPK